MPTKGVPLNESRAHRERRLSDDSLGLTDALRTKLPKLRALRSTTAPLPFDPLSGSTAPLPFDPLSGPGGEQINSMTFGEQFVEALGEFVDAREQYAHSRRGVGGEYANGDDMNKAADALQRLIDRRLP